MQDSHGVIRIKVSQRACSEISLPSTGSSGWSFLAVRGACALTAMTGLAAMRADLRSVLLRTPMSLVGVVPLKAFRAGFEGVAFRKGPERGEWEAVSLDCQAEAGTVCAAFAQSSCIG